MPHRLQPSYATDYLFRFVTLTNLATQKELDALIAELEKAQDEAIDPATAGFLNCAIALATVRWLDYEETRS